MFLPAYCSDVEKILTGIGDKLALFIQWIAVFFGGFIIGFLREWRLTLLLVGFTPFLAISGAMFAKVGQCLFSLDDMLYWNESLTPVNS